MADITIDSILDETEQLSLEDQAVLSEILRKRLVEEKRKLLIQTVKEGMDEYKSGKTRSGSVADFLKDIEE